MLPPYIHQAATLLPDLLADVIQPIEADAAWARAI